MERFSIATVFWRLDDAGELRLLWANRSAGELLRMELADRAGAGVHELFPDLGAERAKALVEAARSGKAASLGEQPLPGTDQRILAHVVPVATGVVAVVFFVIPASDAPASDLSAFVDSVVENVPAMIFMKDAATLSFRRFNRAGEELLGVDRKVLMGKNDYDFFPADQAEFFQAKDREVMRGGVVVDIPEEPIQTAAGERWLHTRKIPLTDRNGEPQYLLGISMDITEPRRAALELRKAHEDLERTVAERTAELVRTNEDLSHQIAERRRTEQVLHQAEEQLRQSQKMEAIGRLAGGIAHDFNNLLSVVLSYSSLMQAEMSPEDPLRHDLEQIHAAGLRAADLTRQLLAFSRRQVLSPRVIELSAVVTDMDRLLRRVVGEDIELRTVMAPGLHTLKLDPSQIEQVILNLAVNARDAMPRGGQLTLELANVDLDEAYAAEHLGVSPGPHVMLAVTDTGHGMDRATQARVFEPFFTTKELGKGTGLGLSTVLGIVEQHGGSIWLYSEVDKGTTFKIYFRASDEAVEPTAPIAAPSQTRGQETVLLVEDELAVRGLVRTILARHGYQVLEAQDAIEALHLSQRFSGRIDLLLTDVVMPRMSGRELAERVAQERPETRILFMSGYTDDAIVHHGVLEAGIEFLQKPITPEALTRRVREVLATSLDERRPKRGLLE